MSEVVGSETDVLAELACEPADSRGAAAPDAPASDEIAQVRSWRAGRAGPLQSLSCLAGPWDRSRGEAGRAAANPTGAPGADPAAAGRRYAPATRTTAMALSALMALGVVALHSAFRGHDEMARLADLERVEQEIVEHNHARNLLIQHLAKDRKGKIAHLRGYAEQIGELEARPPSVVIFTPAEPNAEPQVAELPALRRRIEDDIERIETWTPPPLLEGHAHMAFTAGEIVHSRLPAGAMLAIAAAALMAWSIALLRNLPALRASASVPSSRAVIWWLAPGANLYLPFVIMRDLWQGSDPTNLTSPQRLRIPVISLWWLAALAALGMFGYATYRMAAAEGVFAMGESARISLYADVGLAALAAVTFVVVAAASWNQALRADLVTNLEAQLGPRTAWRKD